MLLSYVGNCNILPIRKKIYSQVGRQNIFVVPMAHPPTSGNIQVNRIGDNKGRFISGITKRKDSRMTCSITEKDSTDGAQCAKTSNKMKGKI